MSHSQGRLRRTKRPNPIRRVMLRVTACVGLIVLFAVAWVSARTLMAKAELEDAIPLARVIQEQVSAGDASAASATADELNRHAQQAASLTSDPIWLAFEVLPTIGPNLIAVRNLAETVKEVAADAVIPLTNAAGAIDIASFKPVDGAIDFQPMLQAQPSVAAAHSALLTAQGNLNEIDASHTLPQVRGAVDQLRSVVSQVADGVGSINRALLIVPAMLGSEGPRSYLVLFQNPAELRSTGGISGAVALLRTEDGQMSLASQISSTDYNRYDAPVLDLPMDTRGIYGDITGRFIQDVNLTPNFVQSAELAQEMWRLQFGETVDGVLSIDPVALSYLLRATGPITLPTGDVLSADNAVQLLLTDVYVAYPDADEQDAFFAAAAASVFSAIAGGSADSIALIGALSQAGAEHRVLVWSADDAEQNVLADTTLAGGLPESDAETQRFGVYFNDATGGKMGPYLDVQTAVGQVSCRADKRPTYAVDVTLTNTAPVDASTALPSYVTADGKYGVAAGNIKTAVSVYGSTTMENLGVSRDGTDVGFHPAVDAGYPVSGVNIELSPGETTTIRFSWLGATVFSGDIETQMTPVIHRNETNKLDLGC